LVISILFLLYYCVPALWHCCSFWLLFGFGLVTALTLLIFAYYAKMVVLWYAFGIAFMVTAILGAILIFYCNAYYLVVGGLLLALLLLGSMGFRQLKPLERR